MKVSIIIPIYNVSKYLVRCLDSVVAQTYQDIECILVDDCGKDNSVSIAEKYIRDYQGPILFKLLHHDHNRGLSAARNTGIKEAQGDYLFFLDSDDAIINECIETLLHLFEKHPDIEFAQGNILNERGVISSYGFDDIIPEYTNEKEDIFRIMLSQITTTAWNRLIRRSFILEHDLYFPEGYFTEDMYWGYFIAKYAHAISFTPKGLYYYYINEGSMMTLPSKSNRMKWFISRLWASQIYLSDIVTQECQSKYQRQYIAGNLLSCLVELYAIGSITLWIKYWYTLLKLFTPYARKITWNRILFLFCLMPPFCFITGKDIIRWRIQKLIIPHV